MVSRGKTLSCFGKIALAVWALLASGAAFADTPSPDTMARRIDTLLAERLAHEGVTPAPLADDSTYLRRATLDLTGTLPSVFEVREFLADDQPDKRTKLVERLLASPSHPTHLANTWRRIMLPTDASLEQIQSVVGVQNWLRRQFAENNRYDNLVADLLVATGADASGPALFYTAYGLEPEKLAANTSRIFLGTQIQCAECHDHPFDHWTQQDFWAYAAFFARLSEAPGQMGMGARLIDLPRGEVTLPDTENVVLPQYPGAVSKVDELGGSRRRQLAIWMASRDNPYLPRAAVNWAWAHIFGRGLSHPWDDMGQHNPSSHPQLLEELADYFVAIRFDLRQLLATLARTEAYQRSSAVESEDAFEPELFARMALKTLTAEQLYDSLAGITGRPSSGMVGNLESPLLDPRRQQFVLAMQSQTQDATDYDAGLPQALHLMNGPEMVEATDPARCRLLRSLEAPFFTDRERIEILFLATLSRYPREEEFARCLEFIPESGPPEERAQGMSDILWALLNSAEFTLNH